MAKRGISVKTLQYLMGHSDVQTTLNIYTHLKLEDAKDEVKRLEIEEEIKREMNRVDMVGAKEELRKFKCV